MSDFELDTIALRDLLPRFQQGDRAAGDELFRRASGRLELLARAMLRRFAAVGLFEQTGDILQEASASLLEALRTVPVANTRAFFGLAAEHIRRRLLDLARRHRHTPTAIGTVAETVAAEENLDRWAALHEAVERLPERQREVFALRFYHGQSWPQVAEMMGISVPTARRAWVEALVALSDRLGGRVPDVS